MILNSLNQTRSIEVTTPAGREKGIVFLGKTFVADQSYQSLKEAIAACRKDLDAGIALLITPDVEKFQVWLLVPNQIIFQFG